jgi:hypothetical protein
MIVPEFDDHAFAVHRLQKPRAESPMHFEAQEIILSVRCSMSAAASVIPGD